jgi:hypothetical protein
MKEAEDMTLIGPVIEKQQKIINDCVEKKLSLSKLQSGIWEKQNSKEEVFDISEMDETKLRDVCKQLHIEVDSNVGKGKLIDENKSSAETVPAVAIKKLRRFIINDFLLKLNKEN